MEEHVFKIFSFQARKQTTFKHVSRYTNVVIRIWSGISGIDSGISG
jgi:hypothetical protein